MIPRPEGWPSGRFGAVLCDPPWRYATYSEKGRNRCPDWRRFKGSPARHYDTMSIDDIAALPVADLAAEDCVLFLWATWPMLPRALHVIAAWGFAYKTGGFDWMKADASMPDLFHQEMTADMKCGYWTRSNSEPCLLATRGHPKRLHADVRMGIIEPARQHSRKPDCTHERIERLVAGPFCELFARTTRAGWTSWGNEVGKFDLRGADAPLFAEE